MATTREKTTTNDLSTLPQWARDELTRLRALAESGVPDSDTFVHHYTDQGRDTGPGLGKGTEIRYQVSADITFRIALTDDGTLQVHAAGIEGAVGEIHAIAVGSNHVRLRIEPRRY